uniref:Uncharacterized protein n=1 Tax=Romanomermis culicivorax TaxID=13658 RepID=A0A915KS44_ROMCU
MELHDCTLNEKDQVDEQTVCPSQDLRTLPNGKNTVIFQNFGGVVELLQQRNCNCTKYS